MGLGAGFACRRADSTASGQLADAGDASPADAGSDSLSVSVADAENSIDEAGVSWTSVATAASCNLRWTGAWPATARKYRAWKPCGDGCSVAPSSLDSPRGVSIEDATGATFDGDGIIRIRSGIEPSGSIVEVLRMRDEWRFAAIRFESSCALLAATGGAPQLLPLTTDGHAYFAGVVSLAANSVDWMPAWATTKGSQLSNFLGTSFGITESTGDVLQLDSIKSSTFSILDRGPITSYVSYGRNQLVVYSGEVGSTFEEIRGSFQGATPQTLVSLSTTDCHAVALSDDKMVWIGTHGRNTQPRPV